MSVNLTVTVAVPLETIEAVQSAASSEQKELAAAQYNSNKALVAAIEALPYRLQPRNSTPEVRSTPDVRPPFIITILLTTGNCIPITVYATTTIRELREMIYDRDPIPPHSMRIIYRGRYVSGDPNDDDCEEESNKTLDSHGVARGAVLHLVIRPSRS